jgi:hypothetical protein
MARTGEAYTTARRRVDRGGDARGNRVLHVTNGDSVNATLREGGVAGRVLTWADVLHDRPVPAVGPTELRRVRAQHLASRGWIDAVAAGRGFVERERVLRSQKDGHYVLWFEADLYDQLLLLQVLDSLRRLGVDPAQVTLVSVGEYRAIAHFFGLGQLTAPQLASLADEGTPLTRAAFELAASAWQAFQAPDPTGLAGISQARSPELRFVGEAFGRLLQEYPSRTDGLSLTQRRILLAGAGGAEPIARIFRAVSDVERRPFLGDTVFDVCLRELSRCRVPLVEVDGRVRVTAAGRMVLAGREDHVRLNGIDRWIGGVHLRDGEPGWRYDERLESLVPG